ncbi:MAG: hypothetical protein PHO02_06410 [Candidatus Nanoarchaeia archaeon]|nr:hypothetical protein [Candidatus Nanoarchaeia archaeon]
MNKRGQVYVLAAIIMSIIIYGMVTISNRVVQESVASDFERISSNYAMETAKLVNSVAGKGDMLDAFKKFTVQFASYAKAQSPRFELISVFDSNGVLYIGNFLKEKIIITCNDGICNEELPLAGCYQTIKAEVTFDGLGFEVPINMEEITRCQTEISYGATPIKYINISAGNVAYQFRLEREQPDVIVVSWETNAKQRKVFTRGNFVASSGSVMTLTDYCASRLALTGSCTGSAEVGDDFGAYCQPGNCKPNCELIGSNEEECLINTACRWDTSIMECTSAS